MKEYIENIFSDTYDKYKSSGHDLNGFYDITLSIITWMTLSDVSMTNKPVKWKVPPETFFFRSVVKSFKKDTDKKNIAQALNEWEKYNGDLWTGLLSVDNALIEDIPYKTWLYIFEAWLNFIVFADIKQKEQLSPVFEIMESLELLMARELGDSSYLTPKELTNTMVHYLEDSIGTHLYDPFSRSGNLLMAVSQKTTNVKYIQGYAFVKLSWKFSNLRFILENGSAEFSIDKDFGYNNFKASEKYDIIISNPPFGGQSKELWRYTLTGEWRDIARKSNRLDVTFLCHALNCLSDKGRAAILVPSIFLSGNGVINELMKRILDQNILDAVIELPQGIFPQTGISTVLLCFNKIRGNEKRLFLIDASKQTYKYGKQICLNEKKIIELIKQIKERNYTEGDEHIVVTAIDIANKSYNLQLSSYKQEDFLIKKRTASELLEKECELLEQKLVKAKINIMQVMSKK